MLQVKKSKHSKTIWKRVGGSRAISDRKYKIGKTIKFTVVTKIGFQKKKNRVGAWRGGDLYPLFRNVWIFLNFARPLMQSEIHVKRI